MLYPLYSVVIDKAALTPWIGSWLRGNLGFVLGLRGHLVLVLRLHRHLGLVLRLRGHFGLVLRRHLGVGCMVVWDLLCVWIDCSDTLRFGGGGDGSMSS